MSISAVETKMPNAVSVEVSGRALSVTLSDGRTVPIPVDQYPRLAYATKQERANWRIIGRGHGIHWEDLDEDISVEGLLAGNRSGESTTSLTRWLMARHQPKFRPWKGERYGKANDFGLPASLLILGESHYEKESDDWGEELTRAVVQGYLEKGVPAFFTKVVHTVLGPDTLVDTYGQRIDFFKSITFCNYIQQSVGRRPDMPPTKKMWEEAAAPFRATLESLRPTHIVACGMRLWDNMPDTKGFWSPPYQSLVRWFDLIHFATPRAPKSLLGCYRYSEGQSVVLAIPHPSRSRQSAWHPVVERFLEYRPG